MYHYSLRTATKGHALQWICVSMIFVCSLLARPALGTATTVDIRCLSSVADARTSVPTVRMCGGLMLVDCSLLARPALGAATTVDIRCLILTFGRSNERPYC